jgi:hypothetical protein
MARRSQKLARRPERAARRSERMVRRVERVANEPRDGRIRVELALRPFSRSRLPLQHGLPGLVEVEVERVTPAALVLRTVGKVFERSVSAAPAVASRRGPAAS